MKLTCKVLICPFIMVVILAFTISCSKNDDPSISSKSTMELMTSHQWKYSSETLNGAPHALEGCEDDDHFSWTSDGTRTISPGLVKCFTNELSRAGTFTLSTDQKTINYSGNTIDVIVEISATKMVLATTAGEGDWVVTYIPY